MGRNHARNLLLGFLMTAIVASAAPLPSFAEGDAIFLQVGAFQKWEHATALRDQVAGVDPNAFIQEIKRGGRTLFRVRLGAFATYAEAEEVGRRLRAAGFDPWLATGDKLEGPIQ